MTFVDGMNEARRKHQYITEGSYELEITKTLTRTHPVKGTDDCITEFKVISKGDGIAGQTTVGETVSWYVTGSPKGREDVAHLWRLCVSEKEGVAPSQIDLNKEVCEHILSDSQPLNGCRVKAVARNITTKAGRPFTVVEFSKGNS